MVVSGMGPVDEGRSGNQRRADCFAEEGGQEILDVSSRFIVRAGDRPVIVGLNDKCAASDARERGDGSWRLGCYDLFSVRNAHRKATLSSPQPSAPENYAEWTARSFYEEASRTLSHPRRSGRAIQGWGHACWDCEGGPRALTDEE